MSSGAGWRAELSLPSFSKLLGITVSEKGCLIKLQINNHLLFSSPLQCFGLWMWYWMTFWGFLEYYFCCMVEYVYCIISCFSLVSRFKYIIFQNNTTLTTYILIFCCDWGLKIDLIRRYNTRLVAAILMFVEMHLLISFPVLFLCSWTRYQCFLWSADHYYEDKFLHSSFLWLFWNRSGSEWETWGCSLQGVHQQQHLSSSGHFHHQSEYFGILWKHFSGKMRSKWNGSMDVYA